MQVDLFATRAATPALGSTRLADPLASTVSATLVGLASHIDPGSQLAAYWYEARLPQESASGKKPNGDGIGPTATDWRPGLFVQSRIKSPGSKGQQAVSVPASALLVHLGRTLVYVRIGPGRFEHREVRILGREGDRWILAAGVAAGEPVVFRQAQVLLSEEFRGEMDND
jgi:hypothetical protein